MANQIGISIEEFENLMNELEKMRQQVNADMEKIGATAEKMNNVWQGKASASFRGKFDQWRNRNMKSFNGIMDESMKSLRHYKTQMQELDQKSF